MKEVIIYLILGLLLFTVTYSLTEIYLSLGAVIIWILLTIRTLIDSLKNKSRIRKGD